MTLTAAQLRDLYDQQLRAEAEVAGADEVVRIGPVWLATYPARRRAFATHQSIPDGTDVAALVADVASRVAADDRVDEAEWKTRGHDDVPGFLAALVAHGFVLDEVETVMIGDVDSVIAAADPIPDGYRVHRAETPDEIRAAEALAGRVFGDDPERSRQLGDELVARWERDPESSQMWFVTAPDGKIVCSGRIDPVAGTDFAGLWGGACDEEHRGKGLYRALTAARAESAKARGVRYLQSDCTEYSQPILARAGLHAVTTTTPAVWRRGVQGPASPGHP